jgi:hypothetical protein
MKIRREIAGTNLEEWIRTLRYDGYGRDERRRFLQSVSLEEKLGKNLLFKSSFLLSTVLLPGVVGYEFASRIVSFTDKAIPANAKIDRYAVSAALFGLGSWYACRKLLRLYDFVVSNCTNQLVKKRGTIKVNDKYIIPGTKIPLEVVQGEGEYAELGLDRI